VFDGQIKCGVESQLPRKVTSQLRCRLGDSVSESSLNSVGDLIKGQGSGYHGPGTRRIASDWDLRIGDSQVALQFVDALADLFPHRERRLDRTGLAPRLGIQQSQASRPIKVQDRFILCVNGGQMRRQQPWRRFPPRRLSGLICGLIWEPARERERRRPSIMRKRRTDEK